MADQWYLSQNGQRVGPVSLEQLQQMVRAGQIQATDLVWNQSMADWTAANAIPALFGAARPAPAYVPSGYQAMPSQQLGYEGSQMTASGDIIATPRALSMLRATKPWVRFLSIMGFIGSGFLIIGAVFMLVAPFVPSEVKGIGVVYLLMGVFSLIPAILLFRYASCIAQLLRSRRSQDLEGSLESQKSFWKFTGIMTLIGVCLYLLAAIFIAIFYATHTSRY